MSKSDPCFCAYTKILNKLFASPRIFLKVIQRYNYHDAKYT